MVRRSRRDLSPDIYANFALATTEYNATINELADRCHAPPNQIGQCESPPLTGVDSDLDTAKMHRIGGLYLELPIGSATINATQPHSEREKRTQAPQDARTPRKSRRFTPETRPHSPDSGKLPSATGFAAYLSPCRTQPRPLPQLALH